MNVNKKLDRFKQWAGERMGGEVKTNVSDDFKSLEVEMTLRHEGQYEPEWRRSSRHFIDDFQEWNAFKSP